MRTERGFAMAWACFLVVLVGALATVMLERDRVLRRDAATDLQALAAFHAAEGGLEKARHALGRDADYRGETLEIGRCTVTVRVAASGDAGWHAVVEAVPGGCRLEADLVPSADLPVVGTWHQVR
jgi:Tfp pilus assembly protein PilX